MVVTISLLFLFLQKNYLATVLVIVRSLLAMLIPIRSIFIFVCIFFAANLCMMLGMMLRRRKDWDTAEVHIVGIGRNAAKKIIDDGRH